jgi:ABC-type oligopeptide transport system substrate-binding subunit
MPAGNATEAKSALSALGKKPAEIPWIDIFHADDPNLDAIAKLCVEDWEKVLKIESSTHPDGGSLREAARLAAGKYLVLLEERRALVNDPEPYLDGFRAGPARSRAAWKDAVFEGLLDAAADTTAFAASADPKRLEAILSSASDVAGLGAKINAAKGGSPEARDALRLALLAEAERRLLAEFVVVPIAFPMRADVLQDLDGLGSPDAWKNPAFFGSLRTAKPTR